MNTDTMFLTLESGPSIPPIVMAVFSWNHGISTGHHFGGSREGITAPMTTHPKTWSPQTLGEWLKNEELADLIPLFEAEGLSGKHLLSINDKHLKELGVKASHRIKFNCAVGALSYPIVQDMSLTCWLDERMHRAIFHMFQGSTLLQASLLSFSSGRPPRRGFGRRDDDNEDDASQAFQKPVKGDPLMSITMKNVQISSFSFGGSSGEDKFTANITLQFDGISYSTQEFPHGASKQYADFFPGLHGLEINYSEHTKPTMREWGKILHWDFQTHFSFPAEFKSIVFTMLLVHSRDENNVNTLPKTALFLVFEFLSKYYIPVCPLDKLTYPGAQEQFRPRNAQDDF